MVLIASESCVNFFVAILYHKTDIVKISQNNNIHLMAPIITLIVEKTGETYVLLNGLRLTSTLFTALMWAADVQGYLTTTYNFKVYAECFLVFFLNLFAFLCGFELVFFFDLTVENWVLIAQTNCRMDATIINFVRLTLFYIIFSFL